MPRRLTAAVTSLKDSGDCTTNIGLTITFRDGTLPLYLATDELLVGANQYRSDLRLAGPVRMSRRRILDAVELEAQNIDRVLGLSLAATATRLDGARAVLSKIFTGPDGVHHVKNIMQGVLASAAISELEVACKLIADVDAVGAVVSWRTLSKLCQWRFKDANTCGAVTAATLCTKRLTGADSCETHQRRFRFSGFWFIDEERTSEQTEIEPNVIDDADGIAVGRASRYSQYLNPWQRPEAPLVTH